MEFKKIKSDFTIQNIGKFRFYSGILVGIGYSLVFNFLFRITLKLCNMGDIITDMKWMNLIDYEFSSYYSILIGISSISFSFCYTIYMWLSNPSAKIRNKKLRLRMAQINPIWILYATLLFLLRLFWFFAGTKLTIEKDFTYLGFLFPLFIFLYCWNLINSIYKKTRKIFYLSFFVFIVFGLILSLV